MVLYLQRRDSRICRGLLRVHDGVFHSAGDIHGEDGMKIKEKEFLSPARKLGGIHAYTCECCGELYPHLMWDLCPVCMEAEEEELRENGQFGAGA